MKNGQGNCNCLSTDFPVLVITNCYWYDFVVNTKCKNNSLVSEPVYEMAFINIILNTIQKYEYLRLEHKIQVIVRSQIKSLFLSQKCVVHSWDKFCNFFFPIIQINQPINFTQSKPIIVVLW